MANEPQESPGSVSCADVRRLCANVSLLFPELPLLERFAAARTGGFDCVEMHWHRDVTPDEVLAAIGESSLRVALLNFDGGDTRAGDRGLLADPQRCREFVDNVPVALELAAAVGCRRLNALVGRRVDGLTAAEQLALARENLMFAADAAAPQGAEVLIEALNSYDNPGCLVSSTATASELARSTGRPNVRLQFDAYHMQRMGEDLAATVRNHGAEIAHVQLADDPGRGDPGTGAIDFQPLLGALDTLRYDGWIGLEYIPPDGDTGASLGRLRECGLLE
jgi:hydroxypyruvate isomerase